MFFYLYHLLKFLEEDIVNAEIEHTVLLKQRHTLHLEIITNMLMKEIFSDKKTTVANLSEKLTEIRDAYRINAFPFWTIELV